MKKKKFVILSTMVILVSFLVISFLGKNNFKEENGYILSPDKSKSMRYNTSYVSSQVTMNFHGLFKRGGSNVVSFNQESIDVKCKWIDNNTAAIYYPKETSIGIKEDTVYFFGQMVAIQYHPE